VSGGEAVRVGVLTAAFDRTEIKMLGLIMQILVLGKFEHQGTIIISL
jgi:hypothetical protein